MMTQREGEEQRKASGEEGNAKEMRRKRVGSELAAVGFTPVLSGGRRAEKASWSAKRIARQN
jgi:hypothetical protein